MGDIFFNITKFVDLNKTVDLDINKDVDVVVDIDVAVVGGIGLRPAGRQAGFRGGRGDLDGDIFLEAVNHL